MSREIRRVPTDFDWPLDKVWDGYLMPDSLHETPCTHCKGGYSRYAQNLYDQWYGRGPFNPDMTGSEWLDVNNPAVRSYAERNVARAPDFYGHGEWAVVREAQRLANLFNGSWSHHLTQDDVDALIAGSRLKCFTHAWAQGEGWQRKEPTVHPTAAEVNEWSLQGMGHDSINAWIVIKARCLQAGESDRCAKCAGHGSVEAYEGQRAEAEVWESAEPPTGDGWQVWETVSEGSPISPVFADKEGIIGWLMSDANSRGVSRPLTREQAEAFVDAGHSMGSFVMVDGRTIPGDAAVAEC